MSLASIREKYREIGLPKGFCIPLGVDSTLRGDLPEEYYDLFAQGAIDPNISFNDVMRTFLEGFYGVEVNTDTTRASIAEYNAFGACAQPYFPDAPYGEGYKEELKRYSGTDVNEKDLRLLRLLSSARHLGCSVLFTSDETKGPHVASLDLLDPGSRLMAANLIIRDDSRVASTHIYTEDELSGIDRKLGGYSDELYAPLPEFGREYYGDGKTSWELFILPPDPTL